MNILVINAGRVQRGECAVTDKWTRTEMALAGGADLVLELPTAWATASAEGFAKGAVSLLAATGVVDTLSFGSECGEIAPLQELSRCLNSPDFSYALRRELNGRQSFASVLVHLSVTAHSPRCTQLPLMTATTAVSSGNICRVFWMCQAWPV